ncbi:hypothetical protein N7G274_004357 [Stereocaulon virgatum]|uniref:Uncharacterized protein n=1 Tax=Stereocaulon virgatum TaxID=373712 RepID=A0ABR4AA61_9LECA
MVILACERIQRKIFATEDMTGDNVTSYLRSQLAERFGVRSIPDGFFYLPLELGGLGLRNPFIPLFLIYPDTSKESMQYIDMAFEREEELYNKYKKAYEERPTDFRVHPARLGASSFMSFDEYIRCAEETSLHFANAYTNLLATPMDTRVRLSNDVVHARTRLPGSDMDSNYKTIGYCNYMEARLFEGMGA